VSARCRITSATDFSYQNGSHKFVIVNLPAWNEIVKILQPVLALAIQTDRYSDRRYSFEKKFAV
jgi:hypothetical protein